VLGSLPNAIGSSNEAALFRFRQLFALLSKAVKHFDDLGCAPSPELMAALKAKLLSGVKSNALHLLSSLESGFPTGPV